MGGSLSTIRWTPYGPVPGGGTNDRNNSRANPLRKSKSFPPPGSGSPSPSNSTSNLTGSYEQQQQQQQDFEAEEDLLYNNNQNNNNNDHLGTSGILMGVNAPPLYDACLVGRWDDVLQLCGSAESEEGMSGMSDDSPKTGTTHCSSDGDEDPGFPSSPPRGADTTPEDDGNSSVHSTSHPCLQTRYTDRRRNTPLHLACRRQPPPAVVRALLNHSPCEAVSRRTADGLTPLHFAAYCGAGVEVVSMLVDRMRSDAAVGRAMRLSSVGLAEERIEEGGNTTFANNSHRSGDPNGRWRLPSEESMGPLPPTRLLDRRRRTPLHCALSGFRTPIRPVVVRKLLAVDPASATLGDERGRTPLSLLFDDYAEEIMEALEEDIPTSLARERIEKGGELHECWKMLRVLLQAAYRGSVSEDEEGEKKQSTTTAIHHEPQNPQQGGQQGWDVGLAVTHEGQPPGISSGENTSTTNSNAPPNNNAPAPPQDRHHHQPQTVKEVNVVEMYDQEHFSMVHAAAGVWECPAPLAKLVLKCLCSDDGAGEAYGQPTKAATPAYSHTTLDEDWDHHKPVEFSAVDFTDANAADGAAGEDLIRNFGMSIANLGTPAIIAKNDDGDDELDLEIIRQPDEETMRLPLHIAVCARPQGREGYSARLKVWLSSTPASAVRRTNSRSSMGASVRSGISASGSMATHPDDRGRTATSPVTNSASVKARGQVYNPRFGRSPSRDSVVAYSSSMQRSGRGGGNGGSLRGFIARSGSSSSISANIAREPFLQHTMVRDVLNLYPDAASVVDDRTGKLPIVLAIEHGKSWETAVGPLLEAYPDPFGGGGDGGMALPDDGPEAKGHREALQSALFVALSSPELHVRDEAIRTVGKLAKWGGVYGMPGSLDGIVSEWLDTMVKHGNGGGGSVSGNTATEAAPTSPEGIVVGPGVDWIQTQSSHLTAVAEVVSHSRSESVSDRVARLCLDTSREYLFSKDGNVREAASRVLGNTLNSVGDADDAANVMREVVLNMGSNDDGSVYSGDDGSVYSSLTKGFRGGNDDVIAKHARLLACNSILLTQWGSELMVTPDICDAIIALIHGCVKDKNTVIRSAAYHAVGPLLGKSSTATHDHSKQQLGATTAITNPRTATSTLKEMRSDILKATRASEHVDVQLALARGLTAAARMHQNLFLCKGGMPIMDAALMLAMSSSVKRPNVQKAFQIFLWVALQMGGGRGNDDDDDALVDEMTAAVRNGGGSMSPGLEKYIELAEGENGRIMMKFVTQTLAKIEDLDDQCGLC